MDRYCNLTISEIILATALKYFSVFCFKTCFWWSFWTQTLGTIFPGVRALVSLIQPFHDSFYYKDFLSHIWTIHGRAGEEWGPSLFLSTTSIHSQTLRHLFAILQAREMTSRILNHIICN